MRIVKLSDLDEEERRKALEEQESYRQERLQDAIETQNILMKNRSKENTNNFSVNIGKNTLSNATDESVLPKAKDSKYIDNLYNRNVQEMELPKAGTLNWISEDERKDLKYAINPKDEGKWFKKSPIYDDGEGNWFTDTVQTIGGTLGDAGLNVAQGVMNIGEGISDVATYGIAQLKDNFGDKEEANRLRQNAQRNAVEEFLSPAKRELRSKSVLASKAQNTAQSLGYVAGMTAIGTMSAGVGNALGASATTASNIATGATTATTFTSAMGQGMTQAYNEGATDDEAWRYGVISGLAEAGSELMFGGLGKAGGALGYSKGAIPVDDLLAQKVSDTFKTTLGKNLSQYLVKAGAEGTEEVVSGFIQALGKKLTYKSEEELMEILQDENLLEQFIDGTIASLIAQTPGQNGIYSKTKNGIDFLTGNKNYVDTNTKEVLNSDTQEVLNKAREIINENAQKSNIGNIQQNEVLPVANENNRYNLVSEEDNLISSAKKYNKDSQNKNLIEMQQALDKRGIKGQFNEEYFKNADGSIDKNTGALWNITTDENGNTTRSIILNPNANQNTIIQEMEIHELLHDIIAGKTQTSEALYNDILDYMKQDSKYSEVRQQLEDLYAQKYDRNSNNFQQIVDEEVVAKALQTKFGNQEEISRLVKYNPSKARSIYDKVVSKVNELFQKYNGNSKLLNKAKDYIFWKNVQNKFEYAYSQEGNYINRGNEEKYYFNNVDYFDEIEYNKAIPEQVDGKTWKSIDESIGREDLKPGVYETEAFDYSDDIWKRYTIMYKEKGEYKIVDSESIDENNYTEGANNGLTKYSREAYTRDERTGSNRVYSEGNNKQIENGKETANDVRLLVGNKEYTNTNRKDNIEVNRNKEYGGLEKSSSFNLPELKEGYTRLYRGLNEEYNNNYDKSKLDNINGYESWTDNYDLAKSYGDNVYYIDVPTSEIKNSIIDEDSNSKTYGDRNLIYKNDKPVGINGKSGNEYMLYTDHDNHANLQYNKIQNISTEDNQGRTLSKQQQEYFKDSKVRDENGNLLTMYHGTPNGSHNEFNEGTYFTPRKEYADGYQNPNASMLTTKQDSSNPKTYEVYLNITNPFSIQDETAKRIYLDEYVKGGNSLYLDPYTDYTDYVNSLDELDWTEGEDLREWLKENHPEYDGLVLDEGGDGGFGEAEYRWRGKSYVPFNSNQIKNVDNTNPTSNADIRYSNETNFDNYLENRIGKKGARTKLGELELPKAPNELAPTAKNNSLPTAQYIENNQEMMYNNPNEESDVNDNTSRNNQTEKNRELPEETKREFQDLSRRIESNEDYIRARRETEQYVREKIKNEFNFDEKAITDIYNKIQNKEDLTIEDVYDAFDNYREIMMNDIDESIVKNVQDIKKTLRNTKLDISDIKSQITDWNDFRKNNFGKLRLVNDNNAINIDSFYKELTSMYPGYFDESITHPAEQLEYLANWINYDSKELTKPEIYQLTNSDLEDVANYIMNAQSMLNETKNILLENSNESSLSNTPAERVEWNDIAKPEDNKKFRKHYQSIIESSNTTAEAKKIAKELMGLDTYIPDSNKSQIERADTFIEKYGVEKAMERLMTNVENESVSYDGLVKKVGVDDVALGERLIEYYSKIGDAVQLQNAIQATALAGTYAGRAVQAFSILNHQTPQGQVTWIQRSVDKINNELKNKRGENAPQFEFTPEMQQKIMNTTTQEEMFNAINEVYEELGQQVPKSFKEKIDSWRYFSMLANPKTHIRNIVGNIAMGKMQSLKNKVAGGIEDTVALFNKKMERQHTLKPASKEVRNFAKADLQNMEVQTGLDLNNNKYNPKSRIENAQRTFKTEALEKTIGKAFDINEKALEVEDAWGLKSAYVKSLSEYMTANNLTPDTITDAQLAKARKYAIAEAKEATFHAENAIATAINQFSRKNKLTKFATDAVLPFVKTPMNVAKAGMEYNPAGLIKALTVDSVKLRKGDITINKYIDNISKGLTGTGIALLGYALSDAGILKASGGEDDKKENYDEATGKQSYSLTINGKTYSLDWLAPAGIPLFVGAEAFNVKNASQDEKSDKKINALVNWANAMTNSMSPMAEMSMISGLTSALKSYQQDSTKMLGQIGLNSIKSYVNQFVPTALGQIARTGDQYERSTTSTEKDMLPKAFDQARMQIMSKIPGLREQLPVKTDVWGKDQEQSDNIAERAIKNFISPSTIKDISNTNVDKELNSLYEKTGESSILPSTSLDKTFTINSEKYRMTDEEYAKYKKNYGETSYKLLNSLVSSSDYKNSTDEQKQKSIEKVYEYAKEKNKQNYAKSKNLEVKPSILYTTMEALEKDGNQSSYINYLGKTTGVSKESEKNQILKDSNYDNKTKSIIYENTTGKDDKDYDVVKATGLNINNYLGYKIAKSGDELKADKIDNGTEKGKTVSGSAKAKVVDYINNMPNTTYTQRMVLYGLNYKPERKSDRDLIVNYINNLQGKNKTERSDMLHQFNWITFYNNGSFSY